MLEESWQRIVSQEKGDIGGTSPATGKGATLVYSSFTVHWYALDIGYLQWMSAVLDSR